MTKSHLHSSLIYAVMSRSSSLSASVLKMDPMSDAQDSRDELKQTTRRCSVFTKFLCFNDFTCATLCNLSDGRVSSLPIYFKTSDCFRTASYSHFFRLLLFEYDVYTCRPVLLR